MSDMCVEGMVKGWRGVAQGLIFLHDKVRVCWKWLSEEDFGRHCFLSPSPPIPPSPMLQAKLSHNSLCCECVYTCVNTSQWKIGGFEAATHHSKIDDKVCRNTEYYMETDGTSDL